MLSLIIIMTLSQLLKDALAIDINNNSDVYGIAQDSRKVASGFVFIARRGLVIDGHSFIAQAQAQGAIAIVGEASPSEQAKLALGVPYIHVADDKKALALLAASFYGQPSQKMFSLGVTGTDGKTTTSYLLYHLLSEKYKSGLLSTASVMQAGEKLSLVGHFTTPEAPDVQQFLAGFVKAGCSHVVIESSSHGFAMQRLGGVSYDVGVFTNLSPEHLDYHKTMHDYRDAKAELMRRASLSILNADDEHYDYFASQARAVQRYGIEGKDLQWRASEISQASSSLRFKLHVDIAANTVEAWAHLPMIGSYNVYNALAALAAAHTTGLDIHYLLERLSQFKGVPGRMQIVQQEPFSVVIDFAHTAPALEKALKAVRPQVTGRIITLIGAAGERDHGKRYPIGQVALLHGDLAVFSEEDSRSEDTQTILQEIAAGAKATGAQEAKDYWLIAERSHAIEHALSLAKAGDLVLLAGKGHEQTLERKHEVLAWDEVTEVQKALLKLGF